MNRVRLDIFSERSAPLFKDLEAGVFGDEVVKPLPRTADPEPSYLTFVASGAVARKEDDVFKPLLTAKKEANVLSRQLLTASLATSGDNPRWLDTK